MIQKVQIRGPGGEVSAALRAHVERRLGFALARFGEEIGRVMVRLTTRGGEFCCEMNLGLRPRRVRTEDRHPDAFAAVNHAAESLARSVARLLERERAWGDLSAAPPGAGPRTGKG